MMKKLALIMCALALLAMAAFPVEGASFTMDVPQDAVQTCPTILAGEPPLDRQDVPIFITNSYQYPDNYVFTWGLPSGWPDALFAVSQVASGETKQASVFITVPDVSPGVLYPVKVKAESLTTKESVEKTFNIQVLSCHATSVSATPSYQKACRETDTSISFNVKVRNSGKSSETFTLKALQNGFPVPYAKFPEPEITVPANGEKAVVLTLTPPQALSGVQKITVRAESKSSTAKAEAEVQFEVADCYGFSASVAPAEKNVCLGKAETFSLLIDNTGETDTYRVASPNWVTPSTNYVSLPSGQQYTVILSAVPESAGTRQFEVSVTSERTGITEKVFATAIAEGCKELAVIVSPSERSVCSNEGASFTVSVKNLGEVEDTVEVASTYGSLSQSKVVLGPGETEDIKLDTPTAGLEGEKLIDIIVSSDGASDETSAKLVVESCYSAKLSIEPADRSTCPCVTAGYSIILENTGKLPDTYTLKFGNITEIASLGTGGKKTYDYSFYLPCDMGGKYEIKASAISEKARAEASSMLTVKDASECWSAELQAKESAEVEVYQAAVIPVKVTNTGESTASYKLSVDGPEWVYIDPVALELAAGASEETYVYASPPHGTDMGAYQVTITAVSDRSTSSRELSVNVVAEGTASNEPETTTPEVTLNASTGGAGQPELTGNMIALVPAWKTMLVGIITLIIIIILIVRFAVLVKA